MKKKAGGRKTLTRLTGEITFEAEGFPRILWSPIPSHCTLTVPAAICDCSYLILGKFWSHYRASSGYVFNIWLAGK